jgi:gluconate 2-dehydrogenase gamma chain
MAGTGRREMLAALALALAGDAAQGHAAVVRGALPWTPETAQPPKAADDGAWRYFSADEGRTVEALVDRLIPPDPETPGGKDAGCAVFIDRQLAGPYGHFEGLYVAGPFHDGTKEQGPQSPINPRDHYRKALSALDAYCRAAHDGTGFADIHDADKDSIIAGLEDGSVDLGEAKGGFFKQLLKDTQQGFFADPLYGGNRGMVGWKMIGFPGARYDYREWVDRHNEPYPHPPIGIADHPEWKED